MNFHFEIPIITNQKMKNELKNGERRWHLLGKAGDVRRKIIGMYSLLASINILVWLAAIAAFREYPLLIGTSVIAYSFGLRHAVDADHIAAIDNVTRKLMQEGKRPAGVGFFFSLGHSTVVVLASIAIAVAAAAIQKNLPQFREVGGIIGTSVSAGFLFVIALINIVILRDVYKTFKKLSKVVHTANNR